MKEHIRNNRQELIRLFNSIEVTNKFKEGCSFEEGVEQSIQTIIDMVGVNGKMIWVGNGGSASIASHMATDFLKNVGIAAMSFNEASLITCISNDLGYENVFSTPLEKLAQTQDVLVAISSSGRSVNILNTVHVAQKMNMKVITLSGFQENNPLRSEGDVNFYVPSDHYGHVEDIHHSIAHCWIDVFMENENLLKERVEAHG